MTLEWIHEAPHNRPSHSLVFVHGLTGTSETTWTADNKSETWLTELLPQAYPRANIYTCGWDWTRPSAMSELADSLIDRLSEIRDRAVPIVLIGHDLGGIIIQMAITMLHEFHNEIVTAGEGTDNPFSNVAANLAGVLFLDTLFDGARSGTKSWEVQMEPFDLGIPVEPLVNPHENLSVHGIHLEHLSINFGQREDIVRKFYKHVSTLQEHGQVSPLTCFCSKYPESHYMKVLDDPIKESSVTWKLVPAYATHTGMTKFKTGEEETFKNLVKEIDAQCLLKQQKGPFNWFY